MKRKLLITKFILAGLLLLFCSSAFAHQTYPPSGDKKEGPNLFDDPGFTNGVHNWSFIGYPFHAVIHGSDYAAENIVTTVTTQDYYGQIYQMIEPYEAGEPVYMSAMVKTDFALGSTARGGILVEFLDSQNEVIDSIKTDMGGVNDWFELYVTGIAPAQTAKLRAGAFIFAAKGDHAAVGGYVQVDDLLLEKSGGPGLPINNPGFESQLSGWTTGEGTWPFDATTIDKHSGNYSALDTVNSVSNADYYGFIFQEIPLNAGQDIYASAWAKSDISPLAGAKGGLIIQFFNGNTYIPGADLKSEIGGTLEEWRQLYVAGTAPSGTTKIKIGAYLWAAQGDTAALAGKFFFDDIIADTSPITPPPPQSDLINSDFENGVNDWTWFARPFVATDQIVYSGNLAAKHTIGDTNDPNDYFAQIYQVIPFSEGQTAYATVWAKTGINPVFTAAGGIQIEFLDSAGVPISAPVQSSIGGNTDWTLLFISHEAPPGTESVKIGGFAWALKNQGTLNGNVFLDKMEFSDTPSGDLILNPGFENSLSGWTIDPTGFPMVVTDEDKHSGDYSAKATIQDTAGQEDYWSRLYQEFSFTENDTLYATLWAKTNIPVISNAGAGLLIEFLDEGDIVIGSWQDPIAGITGWSYLYAEAVAPPGTVKARVSLFAYCPKADAPLGGVAYFDDAVASLDPLPPPNFSTELVNEGFESGLEGWIDLYGLPSELDSSTAHTGTYSVKKTIGSNPDQDYYSTIYQDIYFNANGTPFPADTDVWLTAYISSDIAPPADDAKVGIKIEYFDELNIAYEIGQDTVNAFNDWRQLYIAATIPAGATRARVSGFAFAPEEEPYALDGVANFDDFVYSYTSIPAPAPAETLLNPGFENGINDWDELFHKGEISTTVQYDGLYSSKFEIDNSIFTEDYFGSATQDVKLTTQGVSYSPHWGTTEQYHYPVVKPKAYVYFSGMVKTDIDPFLSVAKAGVMMVFLDKFDNIISPVYTDEIGGITDWTLLGIGKPSPEGADRVRIGFYIFGEQGSAVPGDKAYFDYGQLFFAMPRGR